MARVGVFFALVASVPCLAEEGSSGHPRLVVISERPVPSPIEWAMDVRWADDDSMWIAAGKAGVWEVSVDSETAPEVVVSGTYGPARRPQQSESIDSVWLASRLARSPSHMVVSALVFSIAWRPFSATSLQEEPFELTVDLDVFDDRLLVLGAFKDERGRFAHDGAIAWIGKLTSGLKDLEPIYYSVAGVGAKPMGDCGLLELGAVRFLDDGSFVLVPGVEPGVYWYDASGALERTWESEAFGLEGAVCTRTRPDLASNPEAQYAFVNQRRMVDDILPLPSGPGLLLREHVEGTTRWDLRVLHRDGSISPGSVPVTSETGNGHLRGDVRGNRVALLVVEYGKYEPAAIPRLILAELQP